MMQPGSNTPTKERILHLRSPIGMTLRITVFIWIVFMILGEAIARQKFFQSIFIAPSIGSPHGQFEKQFGRLRRIVEEEGKIDCIMIGSSTVREDFNPLLFRSAFKEKTGKDFSCFNFGVDALTAAGAGAISKVLVDIFHPQILIYGTEPRDYSFPSDAWANTTIIESPWIQHRLGNSNLLGWLFEHSYLLQYQEPIREALHLHFYRELRRYQDWQEGAQWGYYASTTPRIPVSTPPSQNTDSEYVKEYYELLSDFRMFPENLLGLEQVIALQKNGVQVLVLEMPYAPAYLDFFANGCKDYEAYIDRINEYLISGQVPFLRTQSEISIPIDSWWDYNHLSEKGTRLFSDWLGMKLGEMYQEGAISILVP